MKEKQNNVVQAQFTIYPDILIRAAKHPNVSNPGDYNETDPGNEEVKGSSSDNSSVGYNGFLKSSY